MRSKSWPAKGTKAVPRSGAEIANCRLKSVSTQESVRLLDIGDVADPEFLRESALPCTKTAFTAAAGLWRKSRDHFDSQFLQCASDLGELPTVEGFTLLWVLKKMAGPITVERTKEAATFDDFPQCPHHGSCRFGLHELGIVDLTGRVIQNDDQVVPAIVLKPLMGAAVDVQHHAHQWTTRAALPMPRSVSSFLHQPGSL